MKIVSVQRQSGFTLVEIAIVLVIIGLLLGGVLKGTELIENSKIKRSINDINGISAAYYGYVDRFRQIPGDDGPIASLQARGANWATITTASAGPNGILAMGGRNAAFNNINEQAGFWQHLRAAGFLSGDPASTGRTALPRNAFNGYTAVSVNTINGLAGLKVCMSQVSGKAASALDAQLDDGKIGSGIFRSTLTTGFAPAAAASTTDYSEEGTYISCFKI